MENNSMVSLGTQKKILKSSHLLNDNKWTEEYENLKKPDILIGISLLDCVYIYLELPRSIPAKELKTIAAGNAKNHSPIFTDQLEYGLIPVQTQKRDNFFLYAYDQEQLSEDWFLPDQWSSHIIGSQLTLFYFYHNLIHVKSIQKTSCVLYIRKKGLEMLLFDTDKKILGLRALTFDEIKLNRNSFDDSINQLSLEKNIKFYLFKEDGVSKEIVSNLSFHSEKIENLAHSEPNILSVQNQFINPWKNRSQKKNIQNGLCFMLTCILVFLMCWTFFEVQNKSNINNKVQSELAKISRSTGYNIQSKEQWIKVKKKLIRQRIETNNKYSVSQLLEHMFGDLFMLLPEHKIEIQKLEFNNHEVIGKISFLNQDLFLKWKEKIEKLLYPNQFIIISEYTGNDKDKIVHFQFNIEKKND